jgi:hypothetical protein
VDLCRALGSTIRPNNVASTPLTAASAYLDDVSLGDDLKVVRHVAERRDTLAVRCVLVAARHLQLQSWAAHGGGGVGRQGLSVCLDQAQQARLEVECDA